MMQKGPESDSDGYFNERDSNQSSASSGFPAETLTPSPLEEKDRNLSCDNTDTPYEITNK